MLRISSTERSLARLLAVAAVVGCFAAVCLAPAAEPQKYALLVGVAKYRHAKMADLEYPEADATAIADLLGASGYETKVLLGDQATQSAVERELWVLAGTDAEGERVGPGKGEKEGVVLVGLFGHGVQYGSDPYFCPYDGGVRQSTQSDGSPVRDRQANVVYEPDPETLVGIQDILDALDRSPAGSKALLADCCRDDPAAARGSRSAVGSALSSANLRTGTAAFFACSNSERAYEDEAWGHGAFTKAFLDYCRSVPPGTRIRSGSLGEALQDGVNKLLDDHPKLKGSPQTVHPISTNLIDLRLERPQPALAGTSAPVMRTASSPSSTPSRPTPRSLEGTEAGEVRTLVADPKIDFCWCPSGRFRMGSPESDPDTDNDEKPQVDVTLTQGFWMAKTELTQGQWKVVMGTEPWKAEHREGSDYPAVYVSWADAVGYCAKLTDRERSEGRLPADWKYDLPTEAQWEYACRAGTTTRYIFGDDATRLGEYAWYHANADDIDENYAHRVGTKKANAWGLSDLHGNVWEWCRDARGQLPGGRDPFVDEGSYRVYRGGSWRYSAGSVRSAVRNGDVPRLRSDNLGFRLACVPSE